ncbi:lipoprotein [Leptospira sp. severe_002]|uniref:LPS translocon maturation chaperone LptM n=1 Tax=Leptospira sp. severe_002 TaxID=2838237 RepID=UPI001E5501C4|nr:lipoprotein [Leptospira sp. severe_002]
MVPPIEELFVIRPASLRLATFAALAAAMLLAGCGRKGALDPPPGGWQLPQSPTSMTNVTNRAAAEPAQPQYDTDGKPIAPPGPKRSLPMDVLLN